MNLELLIARRATGKDKENFSGPIVSIAQAAVALGLASMILSISILTGFQREIRDKVIGFGAHIQVDNFDVNASFESKPVSSDQPFYPDLAGKVEGVSHIQVFAYKAGILKTEEQIQGVVLKGVGTDYSWDFFEKYITRGSSFKITDTATSTKVLVSEYLASRLMLETGDPLRMYFLGGENLQPRGRRFEVAGIYETGLEEFDKLYVIGDIKQIRKLNSWRDDEVSGFEIFINDFSELDRITEEIYHIVDYDLNVSNVRELYPQIFDWLKLLDKNVIVILVLMIAVSVITMISTLLILILERTNMIGILKALGMRNYKVRRIFFYNAAGIIGKGLLWGNIAGIIPGLIQHHFGILKLDQASYYLTEVPVNLDILTILVLNAGVFLVCMAMLVFPSLIISRITPLKAIRFN